MLSSNNLLIMPSLVCLVLYLRLHACYARPLVMAINKETHVAQVQLSYNNKDSRIFFVPQGSFGIDKMSDGDRINKVRDYSEVLHDIGERKVRKRVERLTLESPPCNTEETVNSKENDTAEVIVVTDYAQPHRKPPIHNRGT